MLEFKKLKPKDVSCIKCGGYGEIHPKDEGPFSVCCNVCGYETLAYAYPREAWKCWKDINNQKHAPIITLRK